VGRLIVLCFNIVTVGWVYTKSPSRGMWVQLSQSEKILKAVYLAMKMENIILLDC